MNAHAPPKEKGAPAKSALRTAELMEAYRWLPLLQPARLEEINGVRAAVWEREGARLFREFWRTGDQKHLRAFFTHVVAMRGYEGSDTQ
jgi:hypothetical protein